MKMNHALTQSLKVMLPLLIFSFPASSNAKNVNLYAEPNPNSKTVATLDLANGIIPIYTPKEKEWVKIADPSNGNVGWVKSSELENQNATSTFSYSQQVVNGKASVPITRQIIRYHDPQKLSAAQQNYVKEMEARHRAFQQSMQEMMRDMDKFFYDNWHFAQAHFPMFVPVVVNLEKTQDAKQIQNKQKIVSNESEKRAMTKRENDKNKT